MAAVTRGSGPVGWVVGAVMVAFLAWAAPAAAKADRKPPNILFFILDDVGIDQMTAFGYGGATAPRTPSIDAIASAGVGFRNLWTMPECSPSRAMIFQGRYPLRTNVNDAILSVDLANSQVSPYESTTPKLLKQRGYESGLFGKFHLTGSSVNATAVANNPLGYTAVHQLGWDYFAGWQDGAPHPIDTSAGGVALPGVTYACGFVPNLTDDAVNGADTGACYLADQSCSQISRTVATPTPGRECLQRGGIFDRGAACTNPVPAAVNFTLQNAYYAGELVINEPDGSFTVIGADDPSGSARGYRTTIESDRTIQWINDRPAATPWMATVSYSSAHVPYQQPPVSLLPPGSENTDGFNCLSDAGNQRVLSNQMIESMDAEIGRVLVETGVATRGPGGELVYDPAASATMIVIVGDNGTYAPGVKAPFNPSRAKATVYQTGVWTPLIVAGPLVREPGRQVDAMVNIADLFQLFGEMAGLDVHRLVPASRRIDSVAMLPYLKNPNQPGIRQTNFTQTASNIKPTGYVVPPCVLALTPTANFCVQLFASQQLCAAEGGVWWGDADGSVPPLPIGTGAPQADCCSVNRYRASQDLTPYDVVADWQMAIRDESYKLVKSATTDYDSTPDACVTKEKTEFYAIDESAPLPRLDNADRDLLTRPEPLNNTERRALASLTKALDRLLDSEVPCIGDGNLDGVVDQEDLDQLNFWATLTGGNSSWYDFNHDGKTTQDDADLITAGEFPRQCPTPQGGQGRPGPSAG